MTHERVLYFGLLRELVSLAMCCVPMPTTHLSTLKEPVSSQSMIPITTIITPGQWQTSLNVLTLLSPNILEASTLT